MSESHPPEHLDGDEYWACSRPESAPNFDIVYDETCRACMLMLGAHSLGLPDREQLFDVETGKEDGTGAEVYERYRHQHGLPPLPVVTS